MAVFFNPAAFLPTPNVAVAPTPQSNEGFVIGAALKEIGSLVKKKADVESLRTEANKYADYAQSQGNESIAQLLRDRASGYSLLTDSNQERSSLLKGVVELTKLEEEKRNNTLKGAISSYDNMLDDKLRFAQSDIAKTTALYNKWETTNSAEKRAHLIQEQKAKAAGLFYPAWVEKTNPYSAQLQQKQEASDNLMKRTADRYNKSTGIPGGGVNVGGEPNLPTTNAIPDPNPGDGYDSPEDALREIETDAPDDPSNVSLDDPDAIELDGEGAEGDVGPGLFPQSMQPGEGNGGPLPTPQVGLTENVPVVGATPAPPKEQELNVAPLSPFGDPVEDKSVPVLESPIKERVPSTIGQTPSGQKVVVGQPQETRTGKTGVKFITIPPMSTDLPPGVEDTPANRQNLSDALAVREGMKANADALNSELELLDLGLSKGDEKYRNKEDVALARQKLVEAGDKISNIKGLIPGSKRWMDVASQYIKSAQDYISRLDTYTVAQQDARKAAQTRQEVQVFIKEAKNATYPNAPKAQELKGFVETDSSGRKRTYLIDPKDGFEKEITNDVNKDDSTYVTGELGKMIPSEPNTNPLPIPGQPGAIPPQTNQGVRVGPDTGLAPPVANQFGVKSTVQKGRAASRSEF